jgi:hypothetical protein
MGSSNLSDDVQSESPATGRTMISANVRIKQTGERFARNGWPSIGHTRDDRHTIVCLACRHPDWRSAVLHSILQKIYQRLKYTIPVECTNEITLQ